MLAGVSDGPTREAGSGTHPAPTMRTDGVSFVWSCSAMVGVRDEAMVDGAMER